MIARTELKTDTLYFEVVSGCYFWTADNVGKFWLDADEAAAEFGPDVKPIKIYAVPN